MRYAAFISYSNADRRAGEALQKAIESFVLPAALRGQDFGRGPLPKRIAPVFRDRWDASASADLGVVLNAALAASDALIVLCSPASAQSVWVGEEIRSFKRLGRADRIFPVLIAGLPACFDAVNQPQGAFHPSLYDEWQPTSERWQRGNKPPLAPDTRPEGDGAQFTVLKLVAALTQVPLTTLTQRQAEAQRRERNLARAVAGLMTVLALGAGVGAYVSWRASSLAQWRLENAVEMASRRVDDAAAFQDRYGVPSSVIRELLDGARTDFEGLTADAPQTPTLALQRARLDRLFARLYEVAGDGAQQVAMARRALNALGSVPTQRSVSAPATWLASLPTSHQLQAERLLAQAALAQGLAGQGDKPRAVELLQGMRKDADALATASNTDVARSLAAQARSQLARLAYEAGELESALQHYQDAQRMLGPASTSAAGATGATGDASEHARLRSDEAEMLFELGRHGPALQVQQGVVEALLAIKAPTPEARRFLASALARRGDMRWATTRELSPTRADYLRARELFTELLAQDGSRVDYKRDLSLTEERAGDAYLQAGDAKSARASFERCLALRRELVARDHANPEWQRDLSVALERMGEAQALQGQHPQAAQAYEEALTLRLAVFSQDSQDAVARRDLAVLWMRIGQARIAAKAPLAQVDTAYAQAIALMTPLTQAADAQSRWHRDLLVAHAERGEARRLNRHPAGAASDFKTALTLVRALREAAPDDKQLEADERWLRKRVP